MKFPHMVKFNGIYFNAGEEIPNDIFVGDSSIVEEKPEEVAQVEEPKATKKPNTKKSTK